MYDSLPAALGAGWRVGTARRTSAPSGDQDDRLTEIDWRLRRTAANVQTYLWGKGGLGVDVRVPDETYLPSVFGLDCRRRQGKRRYPDEMRIPWKKFRLAVLESVDGLSAGSAAAE